MIFMPFVQFLTAQLDHNISVSIKSRRTNSTLQFAVAECVFEGVSVNTTEYVCPALEDVRMFGYLLAGRVLKSRWHRQWWLSPRCGGLCPPWTFNQTTWQRDTSGFHHRSSYRLCPPDPPASHLFQVVCFASHRASPFTHTHNGSPTYKYGFTLQMSQFIII